MADTYTQLYVHLVISPKGRESLLHVKFSKELFSYISGILTNKGHKSIIINGMPDHVHILMGLNPAMAISDLVRELKKSSSSFIHEKKFVKGKFYWQEGYGAFSCSRSQLEKLYNYIQNQQEHHKKRSFRQEYLELLQKFEIPFKQEYLFEFFEDEDLPDSM
jgi:putative transposase